MPFFISNKWRMRWAVWGLFIAEFAFTIPCLTLFALAQPNTYRDKLRKDGSDLGYNSSPSALLYAAARHQPYTQPLVWSQYITDFNVVISVLAMFVLLVKAVFFIMHWFIPALGVVSHAILTALFAYSAYAQTSSDMSDPKRPQPGAPWYLRMGCDAGKDPANVGYCQQAKAAFAVTVIMLALFAANTLLAIYSLVPTKAQRLARETTVDEKDSDDGMHFDPPPQGKGSKVWELHQHPQTPARFEEPARSPLRFASPMTPRTAAYNRLAPNPAGNGSGSDLPFRNH